MKYFYWLSTIALLSLFACNSNKNTDPKTNLAKKISILEQGAFNDKTLEYNNDTSILLIKAYHSFIEKYPEDTLSKNYAYLTAQLSHSIKLYGEAIRKYQNFYEKYPEDERAAKAQIMAGLIYETNLQDTTKAKEIYESFLEKYPDHPMAKDIKTMIKMLSLSDEDLMKMFKNKIQE